MNDKIIRVGLGAAGVCLLLVAVLRPWAIGRSTAKAGGVTDEVFLPVVVKPFIEGPIRRVSITSDGTQGNNGSGPSSISDDGRYIAFVSDNLVSGDMNGYADIFVHDQQTGQTSLISLASDGTQGNNYSAIPSISGNGRFIAFHSPASNLVSGDTNGMIDIYVHDQQTGQTSRVSIATDGTEGNADSGYPSVSADGRFIAFESEASNLVSGDTNGRKDVFVHDRQTGVTNRVSVASDGKEGNSFSLGAFISADGRYIVFHSGATNLVANDTNHDTDVFVHDQQTGQTLRISLTFAGTEANGSSWDASISTDGRFVAFSSDASNLVSGDTNDEIDVFVYDRQSGGQPSRVSVASDGTEGDGRSWTPYIAANGHFITFESGASNLVDDDTEYHSDIFVHDQLTGNVSRVSIASSGDQGNDHSWNPSISGDGRFVAFHSWASNLVSGDTNDVQDVFVHDRGE